MLLKGIAEVEEAARPLAAAEMVLVRIAYAADLPTPDEVIRTLAGGEGGGQSPGSVSAQGNGPSARRIEAPRAVALRMPARSALATQPVSQPAPPTAEA